MADKLRIAIIGLGNIGTLHAKIADETEDLVAVCDIDAAALSKYPDKLQYSDYKKMLDEVKPDVVHVCTPHYLHCEMILAALERNINVLCEKPMCISNAEIERILTVEKKSKAIFGVCLQNRYIPACIKAKEFLEDRKIDYATGQVVWSRDMEYYEHDAWRGKKKTEGGGVLINQAIHTLDMLEWLVGVPDSLTAVTQNLTLKGVIDVEDTAVILAEGKVGFSFFATNGSVNDFPFEITIYAGADTLKIVKDKLYLNGSLVETEIDDMFNIKPSYGNKHNTLIADFYSCVKQGKKFFIDGSEGAKSVRTILAAYESNRKKIKVRR